MTFILGSSKLSYDHFGSWVKVHEVEIQVDEVILGDPAVPGSATPGSASPGAGTKKATIDMEVD